jgi:hypothetical protein
MHNTTPIPDSTLPRRNSPFQRWYDLTAIPDVPLQASFFHREAARKSRLFSTVLFFFTVVIIVFLPCCLLLPNHYDFWIDAVLIVLSFVALGLNREGMTVVAGMLVVIAFQVALTVIIFTTTPFDETSIQIYDLFIMTELLAVSLLPSRCVFLVAIANSGVILGSLLYEPHTFVLVHDLQTQFIPIMIRPIALQFIVAGVAYVWVTSMSEAIVRADRAETVASLEHALLEQKRDLELGIQQILQTHVIIANGNLSARAPLSHDNVLWQIARALNTLLTRFQRAVAAEKELQRMEQAVHISVNAVQQAESRDQLPCLPFTQTSLDPLIAALQGKTLSYAQSPFPQQNIRGNSQADPTLFLPAKRA